MKMEWLKNTSHALVFVGGINWGLVGLFGFNLVETVFGTFDFGIKLTYTLVGIATLYSAWMIMKK